VRFVVISHHTNEREQEMNAQEAIAQLDEKYSLCFVDYDERLTGEQVEHLVAGDTEKLWESLDEWEMESRWYGVKYVIDNTFTDEEWDSLSSEDQDEVRYAIEERDESDWVTELISHTSNPLLRINCISEDDSFSFEPVEPGQVLDLLDIDEPTTGLFGHDEHNMKVVNATLLECSPEYSVLMGYWVISVDLETLYKAQDDSKIKITNPHLWLGNPFAGSGWLTEEPLHGTIVVDRADIHTDKAAFGYSIDEIFGGVTASSYEAEIEVVEN
jgi:hypothetical protein